MNSIGPKFNFTLFQCRVIIETVKNSMPMPQGKIKSYKLHRLHLLRNNEFLLCTSLLLAASLIFVHKITVKFQEAGEAN